jgi:NAD(P)-dependent dehydrogenase (short-subunit alcohol dehydrogenase family)
MQQLDGRVAVVTGAASGIGYALAEILGAEGMKVVLADVEVEALGRAARELASKGIETLAVPTDVMQPEQVRALAERTLAAFGAVHVVCNNAGVFAGGTCWDMPVEDYEWVMGVNVWGVIHGVRTFVPIMLRQNETGHIVNTASMAAVTAMPLGAAYSMSKHAVLALSESLYHELRLRQAKIGVSVLCPEVVATRINTAERNRPARLRRRSVDEAAPPERELVEKALDDALARGVTPRRIAERVLAAIRADRFYILSEDEWRRISDLRAEDIRLARNPTFVAPGTFDT